MSIPADTLDVVLAPTGGERKNYLDIKCLVETLLRENPNYIQNADAKSHLFYSGNVDGAKAWQIARDFM